MADPFNNRRRLNILSYITALFLLGGGIMGSSSILLSSAPYESTSLAVRSGFYYCEYYSTLIPLTALLMLRIPLLPSWLMALAFLIIYMGSPHMALAGVPNTLACNGLLFGLMYSIESNSRLHFLAIIHSTRLQELVTETLKVTRRSETCAFNAINHCAKRVMYNNIQVSLKKAAHAD
jgi:hypothetical protein